MIYILDEKQILLDYIELYTKRIYDMPKFIFYALGYTIERVLSKKRAITTANIV